MPHSPLPSSLDPEDSPEAAASAASEPVSVPESGSVPDRQPDPRPTPAQPHPVLSPNPSLGVPIRCQFCVGQRFRRSRLRAADLKHLLLMRYPVRCLFCSQRQMVSFTVAGVSLPSHVSQPKKRKSR